jgi:phage FluMu protein Com
VLLSLSFGGKRGVAAMSISIQCRGCEKKLKVKDELGGKRIRCPGCGQINQVPAASPDTAPASSAAVEPIGVKPSAGRRRWLWYLLSASAASLVVLGLGLFAWLVFLRSPSGERAQQPFLDAEYELLVALEKKRQSLLDFNQPVQNLAEEIQLLGKSIGFVRSQRLVAVARAVSDGDLSRLSEAEARETATIINTGHEKLLDRLLSSAELSDTTKTMLKETRGKPAQSADAASVQRELDKLRGILPPESAQARNAFFMQHLSKATRTALEEAQERYQVMEYMTSRPAGEATTRTFQSPDLDITIWGFKWVDSVKTLDATVTPKSGLKILCLRCEFLMKGSRDTIDEPQKYLQVQHMGVECEALGAYVRTNDQGYFGPIGTINKGEEALLKQTDVFFTVSEGAATRDLMLVVLKQTPVRVDYLPQFP